VPGVPRMNPGPTSGGYSAPGAPGGSPTSGGWRRSAWSGVVAGLGARVDDLLDLVLGGRCAGCDRPGRALCRDCAREFEGRVFAARPDPAPLELPPVFALARYEGVVRSVLLAHKERGRTRLAKPLGAALGRVLATTAGPGDVVVIVPSRRAAIRTRGYDPLARIARHAVANSRLLGRPLRICPALALARPVADQVGLSAAARVANLSGAMTVRRGFASYLAGRTIVLLDDVVTTGATLAEAARALRDVGGRVRAAVVVAATSKGPDSSLARVFGPA